MLATSVTPCALPVVAWAGWPFFRRGWRSLVTGHLNMFTLIAMGVGAAYVYSAVAMLAPGIFPHAMQHGGKVGIYFEAAAVIVVLVLVGQVLELRARARTGGALRALLDLTPATARLVEHGTVDRTGRHRRHAYHRRTVRRQRHNLSVPGAGTR